MSSKNKMVKNADNSPVFSGMIDKQTVNKDCFECVSDAKKENDAKKKKKINLWTVAGTTLKGGQGRLL